MDLLARPREERDEDEHADIAKDGPGARATQLGIEAHARIIHPARYGFGAVSLPTGSSTGGAAGADAPPCAFGVGAAGFGFGTDFGFGPRGGSVSTGAFVSGGPRLTRARAGRLLNGPAATRGGPVRRPRRRRRSLTRRPFAVSELPAALGAKLAPG